MRIKILVLTVFALSVMLSSALGADIAGTWKGTREMMGQSMEVSFTFVPDQADPTKFTGTSPGRQGGENKITEGKFMVEVAIVGIGCRFPGGIEDPASFWKFLMDKGDGIVEVPEDRWSLEKFYDPDPDAPGRMYTRKGGFLTHPMWDFDPEFFGISPREASIMDPQQRLLLETAWEALDDAGMAGRVGGCSVGVYVGGFTNDSAYPRVAAPARASINMHTPTSSSFTLLSNRISYAFDLQGPSMTIDTACSSSLVAFHEAAQAIARGECDMALVGGVNTMLQPETFISMCKGRFLAADGRSKTFDASADGYVRGEGCGVVVLKRLTDALSDGDRIMAVIRGSAVNQDGASGGLTVPSGPSQEAVIRQAGEQIEKGFADLAGSNVDPREHRREKFLAIGRSL